MAWLQIQIDLGEIPPDPVEQALLRIGAVSIELGEAGGDDGGEPILEPAPGATPLWKNIRLSALLDEQTDRTEALLAVAASVAPAPMPEVRFSVIGDEDWAAKWKQEFRPTCFGAKLWICPPDMPCPDKDGIRVTLAPGLAFGTGAHPTTAMCLDWLAESDCVSRSLLDYGCGSGILAIAGLALGARAVTAVDLDAQALTATQRNAQANPGAERLRVCRPDQLDPAGGFDLIVANILSNTLIELVPVLRGHSRTGTRITLSGILTTQAPDVRNAYASWIDFDPLREREEWALLSGTVV
jgi:ribosomal protein L11 methyltransferase